MRAPISALASVVFFLWGPVCAWGAQETLRVPVVLDYPFIRAAFVYQAFTEAGEKARPLTREGTCIQVEIWEPEISSEETYLKVGSHIRTRAGVPLLDACAGLVEWEGYIEVLQSVRFDPVTWVLHFETVDSRLYAPDRKPALVTSVLWDSIKDLVHPFFDRISIDLSSPLISLKEILPTVFAREEKERVAHMLESIRADRVQVEKDAIRIPLLMEVEPLAIPTEPPPKLSAAEAERFIREWEGWDAFVIYQIESLFDEPITTDERSTLRDTLVENRQAFLQVLADKTISRGFIEAQFGRTWEQLAPIFRKYLGRKPSPSLLTLLSFFTASDALAVLSGLSSRIDLEISRDGLLRLAGLIRREGAERALDYDYAVNPELRKFLGFGAPLEESGPAFGVDELELPYAAPGEPPEKTNGSWLFPGVPSAYAWENTSPYLTELQAWIPPERDPDAYLTRVRQLLEKTAEHFRQEADQRLRSLFVPLILSTAWQETCWRQFVLTKSKLTYVRSHNGTSVGIMQINERVWRGIYRLESLRWNIDYNVRAGCEIMGLYLREKAALNKGNPGSLDTETAAGGTYAVYNNGPGDFTRFLERKRQGALKLTDKLFKEKFDWALNGQFDKISLCFSREK